MGEERKPLYISKFCPQMFNSADGCILRVCHINGGLCPVINLQLVGRLLNLTLSAGCLYLLEHDEEYTFTLPCAYARSILTVPWVELGGKVNITCAKSGYSAVITFQTKPFYGGKLHK